MAVATTTALALAATAASTGAQMYGSHKAAKAAEKARQLTPRGAAAADAMSGQARFLNQQGAPMIKQGASYTAQGNQNLTDVAGYYSPLLRGDRAAIDQVLAPETGAITDIYRGGEKAITRAGVQGAQRDQAMADMSRDRAGQLAMLRPQARLMAAHGMTDIGKTRVGAGIETARTGAGMIGQAGQLYGGIYSGERGGVDSAYAADAAQRRESDAAFGRGMGNLMYDVVGGIANRTPKLPSTYPGGANTPPFVPYPTAPRMNRP